MRGLLLDVIDQGSDSSSLSWYAKVVLGCIYTLQPKLFNT